MKKIALATASLALIAFAYLLPSAFSTKGRLSAGATDSPPPYCNPCLFYGGDFDASGPTPNALSNEDQYYSGFSAVYVPFAVPPTQTWIVAGLFSNNMLTRASLSPPRLNGRFRQESAREILELSLHRARPRRH
jgi:hypothetical protein